MKNANTNLIKEKDSLKKKLLNANFAEEKLKKSNKEKFDLKIELHQLKNETNENKSNKKNDINKMYNTPKKQQTYNILSKINSEENINNENKINDVSNNQDNKNEIRNGIKKNINFESKSPINLKILNVKIFFK